MISLRVQARVSLICAISGDMAQRVVESRERGAAQPDSQVICSETRYAVTLRPGLGLGLGFRFTESAGFYV